jgi:CheY-like chemotaxis protein
MSSSDRDCVLYVEDDADHAELVLRGLARHGTTAEVVHVGDGAAALDYLTRSERAEVPRPRLILLDLQLPKIGGMEVLRAVRASPSLASIPVVVLTTSASEQDIMRAYAHHVNSYLVKPDDFSLFEALVEEVDDYWLLLNRQPAAQH